MKVTHISYKSILSGKELKTRRMGNARQKGRLKIPDGSQKDLFGDLSNAYAVILICTWKRNLAIFVFKGLPGNRFGQNRISRSHVFIKMVEQ